MFAGEINPDARVSRLLSRHSCRDLDRTARYFTSIACDATHCHLSLRNAHTSVQRKVRLNAWPALSFPTSFEIPVATANCPLKTRTSTLPFLVDSSTSESFLISERRFDLLMTLPFELTRRQSSA